MSINPRSIGFLTLVLTSVVGCYRQLPLRASDPAPGSRVSAALSDQASLDLRSQIGPGAVRIEGELAWARTDSLQLRLRRIEERGGGSVEWRGEPVTFARRDLSAFSERTFDRKRSWLAAGAITALGAVFTAIIKSGTIGGEEKVPVVVPPS